VRGPARMPRDGDRHRRDVRDLGCIDEPRASTTRARDQGRGVDRAAVGTTTAANGM